MLGSTKQIKIHFDPCIMKMVLQTIQKLLLKNFYSDTQSETFP